MEDAQLRDLKMKPGESDEDFLARNGLSHQDMVKWKRMHEAFL